MTRVLEIHTYIHTLRLEVGEKAIVVVTVIVVVIVHSHSEFQIHEKEINEKEMKKENPGEEGIG